MNATYRYFLLIILLVFTHTVSAQHVLWKKAKKINNLEALSKLHLNTSDVQVFELSRNALKQSLSKTSSRNALKAQTKVIIQIPQDHSILSAFEVYEATVFSPELTAKYPNIKSYIGYSIKDPSTRLRMSVSPQGVHAMITAIDQPAQFIQPLRGTSQHILYHKKAEQKTYNSFNCATIGELDQSFNKKQLQRKLKINEGGANDQILRKFRIAISTTSEYTAYHNDGDDSNGNAIADALAAMNATLTRVNEVFETDMAITFELVDATQLIYNNTSTDPYSSGLDLNNELQSTLTSTIGNAAYDIGHLFTRNESVSSAGCLSCVCEDDNGDGGPHKGAGFTGAAIGNVPEGDAFDISFVAHEIGHQMGATHTASDGPEGLGTSAEPGSGSTIMGYAGITGFSDVQAESDPYFHYYSIQQILFNIINSATCWQSNSPINIVNNPPVANAGSNYNIPAGTPYVLTGSATDTDGVAGLTYSWEQIDSAPQSTPVTGDTFGPTLATGPTARSLPPSSLPIRHIPRFSSVIAGNVTQTNPTKDSDWETVSTVARDLNWALTVRDRSPLNASGGQTSYDTMQITVENTIPFAVKNPISWAQESNQTIEWEVANTNNTTINCQNVNIKLSTDGGVSFPIVIANNVANNGLFDYTVPNIANTDQARILIEAADNIFYDVSDFNFSINNSPSFFINQTNNPKIDNENNCDATALTYTFDYTADNGFLENTVFSVSGVPSETSVTFSPTNMSGTGTFTMTLSNINVHGLYDIIVTGTSNSVTKNIPSQLSIFRHCAPDGDNDISFANTTTALVEFNTINNATGTLKTGSYISYHNISTNVNRNSSYNLTVEANSFTEAEVKAWIDWNQDCDFDDAGEEYNLGITPESGQPSNVPLSITIPPLAKLGATVMRIAVAAYFDSSSSSTPLSPPPANESIKACDDAFIGADVEFEDYTIFVQETLSVNDFESENFSVFPNPNDGSFTLKLDNLLEPLINVEIYDIRGRRIYKKVFKNRSSISHDIKLNNTESGLYFLKVNDGIRTSNKKIIIE